MKPKRQKNKNNSGFTLLETLVAISVLVIVFGALVSLMVASLRSFEMAKQRYTAAKIAQEGMELLINKKENNILCIESGSCSIPNWRNRLIGSWEVDATKPDELLPLRRFNNYNSRRYLCLTGTESRFEYCGDPDEYINGNFRREVKVISRGSEKILVESVVRWQSRGGVNKDLTLTTVLFGN
ncbi:MAG: hypothetical protein A3A94_01665 [Candidatus Portnoybacteria bacterium RIFCSPLOWO2_01_FULL_43_11]|uniref:Uncharacterized protein n=4 Tax=Candidatus Portnoyibacteriota TaxID=1817913 RepID=A0A1G2FCP2_9BACT|nr:MAG: hypothetical protein A2815_00410 [Candidatus Portnoybacteria bacterium RIFCSPHIGHO2_01_FULL_40_12b]OGZ39173.1 MAG: hypothetical protein A3A94_01665 [Candidatus Portnoybacteria bacterium RIFCSPLOWO2_01_FULL_43_11]OGZ39187.1 MAG: hypothetical protein A3E90_01900 [Candidatus Portnoybacteria bacterium RIFCSPHIGHO2_12_FULL_40_11]OGZ39903.1 MAG: hypothetical protein A3I20_02820 [Candidatus Portnoybacteria bacterium RIFCSPLOWO2_02_FULL_40_15]